MVARDTHRAKEFYEPVLRVPFSSGHPGAWRTEEISPPLAILPSQGAEPGVQLSYRVDDITAIVVRAARPSDGQCLTSSVTVSRAIAASVPVAALYHRC